MKLSKRTLCSDSYYKQSHLNRGFTLIELLVVIAIIAGLAVIGFGTFFKIAENAKGSDTKARIAAVAAAMEARAEDITSAQRTDIGIPDGRTYPDGDRSDEFGTSILIDYISGDYNRDGVPDDGVRPMLDQVVILENGNAFIKNLGGDDSWVIVDAWGNPLRYTFPGEHNNHDNGFDLESAGPDEMFDGNDAELDNIILE